MMKRSLISASVVLGVSLLLLGCPEKKTEVTVTSAPTVAPPPPTETAPTIIAPLEEDAGADTGPDAAKKYTGTANTLAVRLKQCCNSMKQAAALLGNPTEVKGYITQCDTVAAQVAKGGTPTELAPLRQWLQGKPIPGCQF